MLEAFNLLVKKSDSYITVAENCTNPDRATFMLAEAKAILRGADEISSTMALELLRSDARYAWQVRNGVVKSMLMDIARIEHTLSADAAPVKKAKRRS